MAAKTGLKLFNSYTRVAATLSRQTAGLCKNYSNGAHAQSKMYELRTYAVNPANFGEFLKLTSEKFHLRTAHSRLIGYWATELGGVNEVVHIWEYGMISKQG